MRRHLRSIITAVFLGGISAVVLTYHASASFRSWCSYFLAVYESKRLESHVIKTRDDAEHRLFWVTKCEYASLSNLFAANFLLWDANENGYVGDSSTGRIVYRPQSGDQYVSYKVLGRMPIDFIYDKQGKIIYWIPSFEF